MQKGNNQMSNFFSFQYLSSNTFSYEACSKGNFCAHLNINEISSFDEGSQTVIMTDGKTWFVLTDDSAENLSEKLSSFE